MLRFNIYHSVIVLGASAVGVIIVNLIWKKKNCANKDLSNERNTEKLPSNWRRVGEVSELMIYPVKSAKAHHLVKARCAALGLVDSANPLIQLRDREFIVYDQEKKKAVSGLVNTKITLLESKVEDDTTIRLSFPEREDFYLKLPKNKLDLVKLDRWWGEVVSAVDCGDEVACWLSEAILGPSRSGLRLGHFSQPSVTLRTVANGWTSFAKVYPRLRDEYLGAYSYMASYLIVSENSVEDLNKRLESPVTPSHFRANIVVKGNKPYSEDQWDWIKIGDKVIMRGFKPCTRCVIVAIDPKDGKMDPNFEPLRTLKKYRQIADPDERELAGQGNEPVFGLYTGLHHTGSVMIGDPVYVGV
ncbi:mitochondrial amidoxime-reducing component 1-like [Macrosteles quadrilineatus]|uniref:mitochondrial amidoxime-reducing component 1-like n=1 Tax=Macrosteles quadrilineatus TaxID=74068 RepID=UPI0023E127B3|nr:mitochondrial amidoxime-reducing component 1-like [Macrosteles quadrilineatus]XP_054268481.1 mitochondrial amidoxime-reducing component 1-like [Macrosteles quadrilineatus]